MLASAPIEVTPGLIPGYLEVVAGADTSGGGSFGAVEVILDASGSMLQRLDGERRIEIAKKSLGRLVRDVVPTGTPFALRVFGHREIDSCRTDLEIPLAPLDVSSVTTKVAGVEAKNRAKTPIADSLLAVRSDLAAVEGPATVILLTDGEETCDGDPAAAIDALQKASIDVRVNIVGFAIDDLALKEQFEAWARAGGGRYIEANDGDELSSAMQTSLEASFTVYAGNDVVATGVVGGERVQLKPGTYRVRSANGDDIGEAVIKAAETQVLTVR